MKNKKLLSALMSLILFIVYVAIIYTNRENQWVMALAALVLLPIIAVVSRDLFLPKDKWTDFNLIISFRQNGCLLLVFDYTI